MNSKEYHKEKMSGDFTMKMLAAFHSGRNRRRKLPLEKRNRRRKLPLEKRNRRRKLGDIVIYKTNHICIRPSFKRKIPRWVLQFMENFSGNLSRIPP